MTTKQRAAYEKRRIKILNHIYTYGEFPKWATLNDVREITKGCFINIELTSLGELEVGFYEEAKL